MFHFRKLTATICTLCLILTCLSCGFAYADRAPADYTGRIVRLGLNEDNNFAITRERAKNEPMGEEDSWTIFVYLCGSDLETDGGLATGDLEEMLEGSVGSRVRYVILTGGALEWQNDLVDGSVLELYLIEDGEISLLDSSDSYYYMNDPHTLYSFLSWGVANYPADKMGVVFWDHGGGSIMGVCVDELFFEDMNSGALENSSDYSSTLTLPRISEALSSVYDEMTDQFEFIGYDACLMGTLENAFLMSSYARYLYASEESEPGYGWDYAAIGEAIGPTGEIDGAELGRVVCDSFYDSCMAAESEENATLACIDLTQMDDLALAFDDFATNLLYASENPSTLAAITQRANRVDFFGGNSKSEGYFNLVDLGELVGTLSSVVGNGNAVLDAIDQAVLYTINGIYHEQACGLSVYYPLHVEAGTGELGAYAEVACSPYYYGYVAQNAYAAANGTTAGYAVGDSLNAWVSSMDPELETIVEDYGDVQITGESPYVVFYDEPMLMEDGTYGFSLTDEVIPYISSVEADIYFLSDDGEDLVCLGSTDDIIADWETGVFLDNFDGLWFCLPDEQLISATAVSVEDTYAIYTTPVLLNDEEANLRFVVDYTDYSVTLDGIWSGVDEYGLAGRNTDQLKPGDVIVPLFEAVNLETDEEYYYYGEEYVYDGSNEWFYTDLFDADYYYQFCIYDVYGDYYLTDGVFFTVEDGEIFFELDE